VFASKFALNSRQALAAFAAGLSVLTTGIATPAFANSSDSADISAPLRAAQTAQKSVLGGSELGNSGLGKGDAEFRQLFASWRSLDQGGNGVGTGTGVGSGVATGAIAASNVGANMGRLSAGSIPSLMPVDSPHLTSGFGMRWHPVLGGRRPHKGVDLADPVGTPVHATGDGLVGRADWFSGYGLYVQIEHGSQMETRYGHMSRLNVAAGQFVHRGDVIGYVGATGRATGPHLHYEVRVNGVAVNPIPYMQGAGSMELARAANAKAGSVEATVADAGDE
jgi:murein DD-endopeptidase MepM/ murein hydrolase activator NlpD